MTKVLITESYLEDIADSIRAKNGTENTYKPSEMAGAIDAISGITPTGTKEISITQNGTTTEDVTNYASAEINVSVSASSPTLQTKTVTPTESTQNVSADNGYDGLSQVTVNPIPSSYVQPSGSLPITVNNTYDVTNYASVDVNVSGGGGGSNIPLLGTVTVTSDTREFDIDLTDYQNYNFFFVVADVTLSASDWLYYVKNGSSASGGTYDYSLTTHNFIIGAQLNPLAGGNGVASGTVANTRLLLESGAMTNLYVYAYASNKTIKAGSTFKIYGGNYADL